MEDYKDKELFKINHLIITKNYEEALDNINLFLKMDLDDYLLSTLLHHKGVCLMKLNQFKDALECFNASWIIDDYFIKHNLYDKSYYEVYKINIKHAYFLSLAKYYNNNNDKKAFSYFHKVLILNPQNTEYILNQTNLDLKSIQNNCKMCYYKKDYINALKFADMALKIDKNSIENIFYKKILSNIDSSQNYNPMDEIYELYYDILNKDIASDDYHKNKFDELIEELSRSTKIIDNPLLIKGFMLNSLGEYKYAEEVFNKCISSRKYNNIASIGLIQSLNRQKEYYQALIYFEYMKFDYNCFYEDVKKIFSNDETAIEIIQKSLNEFDVIDNILLKGIMCLCNLDFENAIKEYDKVDNDYNLKAELLFSLHRYDDAVKSISDESDTIIKFMDYCKNKENTGFFGVFKSNLSNFNWEYAYLDLGYFKRIMATTIEELNYKVVNKDLIWKILDDDLVNKTIFEDFIIELFDVKFVYKLDIDFNKNDFIHLNSKNNRVNGNILCLKKEFKGAIKKYNEESNDISILNNKGYAYLMLEKFDNALKCFNEGLEIDSKNPFLLINKSFTYLNQGKYYDAFETFKNCELIWGENFNKDLTLFLKKLALSLYAERKFQDSMYCFDIINHKEELNINTNDYATLQIEAECLYDLNRFKESFDMINYLFSLNYQNSKLWGMKGKILIKYFSEIDEAIKCFEKALLLNNEYETKLNHINLLVENERFSGAIRYCNKLLKEDPNNFRAIYFKGVSYIGLKKFKTGENNFRKLIKMKHYEGYLWLYIALYNKYYFLNDDEEILKNNKEILECLEVLIKKECAGIYIVKKAEILGYLNRIDELLETFNELLINDLYICNEKLINEVLCILDNILEVDNGNQQVLSLKNKFHRLKSSINN